MSQSFHIAQLNVAKMKASLDDPIMEGFTSRLDEINALADEAAGFVWRLQTEDGDATALRAFDDNRILVNMSVWKSVEALQAFTYKSNHVELIRDRREWFHQMEEAILALWWIPAGSIPGVEEAKDRLEHLQKHGATPFAFTFRNRFTVEEMLAFSTEQ